MPGRSRSHLLLNHAAPAHGLTGLRWRWLPWWHGGCCDWPGRNAAAFVVPRRRLRSKPRIQWQGAHIAYVECEICDDTGPLGWTEQEAVAGWNARHRQSHSVPGENVTPDEGFEAEQDGDSFTVRFPDGHAVTARADGQLIVTKAVPGFVPFDTNIAALTPSALSGDAGEGEALRAALTGFGDDYMTSEQHHPGYVLIPVEQFERICAAMGAE